MKIAGFLTATYRSYMYMYLPFLHHLSYLIIISCIFCFATFTIIKIIFARGIFPCVWSQTLQNLPPSEHFNVYSITTHHSISRIHLFLWRRKMTGICWCAGSGTHSIAAYNSPVQPVKCTNHKHNDEVCCSSYDRYWPNFRSPFSENMEAYIYFIKLDIIVMGTITGAPLLPFYVLVTEAWNVGQGHKPPHCISRSCQDEQLMQVWWM